MKKIFLFLAITFALHSAKAQTCVATGTTKAGKFGMCSPLPGTINDSVVVWRGTGEKLMYYMAPSAFLERVNLHYVLTNGNTSTLDMHIGSYFGMNGDKSSFEEYDGAGLEIHNNYAGIITLISGNATSLPVSYGTSFVVEACFPETVIGPDTIPASGIGINVSNSSPLFRGVTIDPAIVTTVISNLQDSDLTPKKYVDDAIGGLTPSGLPAVLGVDSHTNEIAILSNNEKSTIKANNGNAGIKYDAGVGVVSEIFMTGETTTIEADSSFITITGGRVAVASPGFTWHGDTVATLPDIVPTPIDASGDGIEINDGVIDVTDVLADTVTAGSIEATGNIESTGADIVASSGSVNATFNVTAGQDVTAAGKVQGGLLLLDPNGTPSYAAGATFYDTTCQCYTTFNNDSNVSLQNGREGWIMVKNTTGSTIPNGKAVYLSGYTGTFPAGYLTVGLAKADAAATTIVAGLTTESIANNAIGYVTSWGDVHNVNTSTYTASAIYLSAATAGELTQTAPSAPNYRYRVGIVGNINSTTGTITVTPSTASLGNGTGNQVFGMNAAGNGQETKTIAAQTGFAITHTTGTINVGTTVTGLLKGNGTGVTAAVAGTDYTTNLTGPITSVGNATSVASQTGAGSTFVMQNTPGITTPTVTGLYTGSGGTLTGSATAMMFQSMTGTFNGTGIFTGSYMNITNTASNVQSRVFDWQVGGNSKYNGDMLGNFYASNSAGSGGGLFAGSTSAIFWTSRTIATSPADGNIRFTNAAASSFGLMQFGGGTSAFPALKRNGATVETRLADDSGLAPMLSLVNYRAVTTTTSLTATDYFVTVTGTITVTLPASVQGRVIKMKNIGTGAITVQAPSGNIDGAATKTLNVQYTGYEFTANGTDWYISGTF